VAGYSSMKDVAAAVSENGNLMTATLGELREALGYNRLGVRVLGEIARSLQDEKLGYFPTWALEDNDVPRYGDVIRIYRIDSAVGRTIEAVLKPSPSGDELLLDSAGSEAVEKLRRIRIILGCD